MSGCFMCEGTGLCQPGNDYCRDESGMSPCGVTGACHFCIGRPAGRLECAMDGCYSTAVSPPNYNGRRFCEWHDKQRK